MAASIKALTLKIQWSERAAKSFGPNGYGIPWSPQEALEIKCPQPPLTIEDIAYWIEARIEGLYYAMTKGKDQGQCQVCKLKFNGLELPWGDYAGQHLKNGDTLVVDAQMATASAARQREEQWDEPSEEELKKIRAALRFDLNDRVICFCGPRWFSGHVVGSAVPNEGDVLPYLVKTDALPGVESRTISVPMDRDDLCTQEICWAPHQVHLVKAATQLVKEAARPKLRFAAGDKVVVRISNSKADGLEQWVDGKVAEQWPKLSGETKWEVGDVVGEYASHTPYRVQLADGKFVYCHCDNFTLIRREGLQAQERSKGVSKRLEVRRAKDGGKEKFDHLTERSKRMLEAIGESDDSSDE